MEDGKIANILKRMRKESLVGGEYRKAKIDRELEKAEGVDREEKVEDVNKHKWKGVM